MNNEREEALKVYKEISKTMLNDLGVLPGPESRDLYHTALSSSSFDLLSADDIVKDLREQYIVKGAYVCDYDYFRTLCQAHARSIERLEIISRIAILSLMPRAQGMVEGSLPKAMDKLEKNCVNRSDGEISSHVVLLHNLLYY
jgi:hypothetical protein